MSVSSSVYADLSLRPEWEGLAKMCAACNFTIEQLFERVKSEIPELSAVSFEIWSCKFMNIVHASYLLCYMENFLEIVIVVQV